MAHVNWEDKDWDRMLQFRHTTGDRFAKTLTDYVRNLDPHARLHRTGQAGDLVPERAGRPQGLRE